MSKTFSRFWLVLAALQIVAAIVISKAPDLIDRFLLSDDSKYSYLLRSELKYDIVIIGLLIVLSPQIIQLMRYAVASIFKLIFVSAHLLMSGRYLSAFAASVTVIAAALSAGFLAQSVLAYGNVLVSEISEHEKIYKERLISEANLKVHNNNPLGAVPPLERVLKLYPADPQNPEIEARVRQIKNQDSLAIKLEARGDELSSRNNEILAIRAYQSVKAIAPYRLSAARKLENLAESFRNNKSHFVDFYTYCKDNDLPSILRNADKLRYAIGEVESVKLLQVAKQPPSEVSKRIYFQLCAPALDKDDAEAYYDRIWTDTFGKPRGKRQ